MASGRAPRAACSAAGLRRAGPDQNLARLHRYRALCAGRRGVGCRRSGRSAAAVRVHFLPQECGRTSSIRGVHPRGARVSLTCRPAVAQWGQYAGICVHGRQCNRCKVEGCGGVLHLCSGPLLLRPVRGRRRPFRGPLAAQDFVRPGCVGWRTKGEQTHTERHLQAPCFGELARPGRPCVDFPPGLGFPHFVFCFVWSATALAAAAMALRSPTYRPERPSMRPSWGMGFHVFSSN
jgi:hypothetical protein